MRIEVINGIRVEYPDEGMWMHDNTPDYTRNFKNDFVMLGKDAEPWAECTDEEKISFEESHPAPVEDDQNNE